MKENKKELPFIDGVPALENQQRITWITNGESTTGSNSSYRAEGVLNRVSWQLYQNIVFLKNSFEEKSEAHDIVLDKVIGYENDNIIMKENMNILDTNITSLNNRMDDVTIIVENSNDSILKQTEKIEELEVVILQNTEDIEQNYTSINNEIGAINTRLEEYDNFEIDAYTKQEADDRFEFKDDLTLKLEGYATTQDLNDAIDLIPDSYPKSETLSTTEIESKYALKSELTPHIDAYTKTESDNKYATKVDTYSKEEVDALIPDSYPKSETLSNVEIADKYTPKTELEKYYTKVDVDAKFALKTDIKTPIDAYTKTESDNKYATKVNVYTKDEVEAKILDITPQTLGVYNITEVDDKFALKSDIKPPIDAYTKTESDNKYALKSEVNPSIDAYTKQESDNKFATIGSLDDYLTVGVASVTYVSRPEIAEYAKSDSVYDRTTSDSRYVLASKYEEDMGALQARLEALESIKEG